MPARHKGLGLEWTGTERSGVMTAPEEERCVEMLCGGTPAGVRCPGVLSCGIALVCVKPWDLGPLTR